MRNNIFLVATIISVSCGSKISEMDIICDHSKGEAITSSFVCELDSEIRFQSMVGDMQFVDDEHFVVLSAFDPSVCLYNIQGHQISSIGDKGRAKGEYLFPSYAAEHDGKIYLTCSQSKKIIAYDLDGKYESEMSGFENYSSDFVVKDDYIYRSKVLSHYIEVIDTVDGSVASYLGEYDEVDKILGSLNWTNIMCEYGDGVLYIDPATLAVYSVVGQNRELLFNLYLSDYKVNSDVNYSYLREQANRQKMIDYIQKCSTICHASTWGDTLYVITTMGSLKNSSLITVDMKMRKASSRPIEGCNDDNIRLHNYQMHNGTIYSLATDSEQGFQFLSKLNI